MAEQKELVLVTGGSGFVGSHCIIKCLRANYRVRTTVRSLKREAEVRQMLAVGEAPHIEDVSFVEADLTRDEGWAKAVEGCTYVLHVASPFPPGPPKNDDDLIVPAREGTLRVLRAARAAGVKRVVLTSSVAAIAYGHRDWDHTRAFTEKDWSDVDGPGMGAYLKSKTIAERAAWDYVAKEGGLELAVVNPGAVFGPVLAPDSSTSIEVVSRLMSGSLPACPQVSFTGVDVRDAADLHLLAMTDPKANNERFACVAPPALTMKQISLTLHEKMGTAARRAPTRELPNFLLRVIALFDPAVKLVLPELGVVKQVSSDKAKEVLGWKPRSVDESVVDTAESLIKIGVVKQ